MWKSLGGLATAAQQATEAAAQAQKAARKAMNELDSHMMQHIDESDEGTATGGAAGGDATDGWPEEDSLIQSEVAPQRQPAQASNGWDDDDDGWDPAPSPQSAPSAQPEEDSASVANVPKPRSKLGSAKKSSTKPKPKVKLKRKAKPAPELDNASMLVPGLAASEEKDSTLRQGLSEELAQEVAQVKEELAETRHRLESQLAESEASKLALKKSITAKAQAKVKEVRDECATKCKVLETKCAELEKQLAVAQRDDVGTVQEQLADSAKREAQLREELDAKAAELDVLRTASEEAADAAAKAAESWASEVRRLEEIIAAGVAAESAPATQSSGEPEVATTLRAELEELRAQLAAAKAAGMTVQQLRSELSKRGLSPKGTKQEMQMRLAESDLAEQHAQAGAMVLGPQALRAIERQTVRETAHDALAAGATAVALDTRGDEVETAVPEAAADAGTMLSEAAWAEREQILTSAHVAALEAAVQQAAEEARQTALDSNVETQQRIENLEAELSRASAAAAATSSDSSTLSDQLQAECEMLRASLADTQADISSSLNAVALAAREDELGNAAEKAARAMDEMMGEATQTDAVLASSKQEAEALRERVHSLEAAVASHGDAISAEQQKLIEQSKVIEVNLTTELKEVRSALSEAEDKLNIELAKGKQRAKWKEEFERQLDATEAAVLERDETIAKLKAEVKQLKKGDKQGSKLVDELKATLEKEKKDRAKVVKQKQEKIDFLNAELNATRDSVGEKHNVADAAIRQTEEASARAQALEVAQKSLAEQLQARDSEVEAAAQELKRAEEKVQSLEGAKQELSAAAEKARETALHAMEEAEAARQDVTALQSALAAQKDSAEASEAVLRARAEEMVGSARQGMRELEREVEELQQKVDDTTKEAERAMEERDNNNAEFIKYKTRSHMMLKKKEEELRRSMESAPQAEGALREALSQVDELKQQNEFLQQQLETAETNANIAPATTVAAGDAKHDGGPPEEIARLNQVIDELRTGAMQREKALTQDMEALLNDSEAAEARHAEAMEVEQAARLTLEKALDRQAEATEQLDRRLQREMEASLAHKTRADALTQEMGGANSVSSGGAGSSGGNAGSVTSDAAEDAIELRRMEQMQGIVLHQQLQNEGAAEGARPTGSAALKPVDLDYIRNVVVKLLETEEIDTYLPILSKLLSFSDADEDVVRDSFGEKETYTFRLW